MKKIILLAFALFINSIFIFAENENEYNVTPAEMDIPPSKAATPEQISDIEKDLGDPDFIYNESADDPNKIKHNKNAISIKDFNPRYNPTLKSKYAITQDCKLLELKPNTKNWTTLCENFSQNGHEVDSFIASSDENYFLIKMMPLTATGFLLIIYDRNRKEIKSIGTYQQPIYYFFTDNNKNIVIIEKFTGKIIYIDLPIEN